MSFQRIVILFVAVAAVSLVLAPTAAAHKTTYTDDGKVKIVWGFLSEPAATWTKTGLDLRLSDNATGAAITGADTGLTAHLLWGDQALEFENLRGAHGNPGAYTDAVTLTRPGLYSLKLEGTINGTAVSMTIPGAHEVAGIEDSFFPTIAESPFDADAAAMRAEIASLKERIDALDAKIQTQAQTPAVVTEQAPGATMNETPGVGLLAAALAAVGAAMLVRRRT